MSLLKDTLAQNIPWLGKLKRGLHALRDSLSPLRSSYSQHGEDVCLEGELARYDLSNGIYVDVGANHPTSISNTYRFYRRGLWGVTIDPNAELVALHRRFRKRDISLCLGCGDRTMLGKLRVSKTPVLSNFRDQNATPESDPLFWRLEYVPILKLDEVMKAVEHQWVYFLNVDVEGLDHQVLVGATETLSKVLYLCVEANDGETESILAQFLKERNFEIIEKRSCNLILKNSDRSFEKFLKP